MCWITFCFSHVNNRQGIEKYRSMQSSIFLRSSLTLELHDLFLTLFEECYLLGSALLVCDFDAGNFQLSSYNLRKNVLGHLMKICHMFALNCHIFRCWISKKVAFVGCTLLQIISLPCPTRQCWKVEKRYQCHGHSQHCMGDRGLFLIMSCPNNFVQDCRQIQECKKRAPSSWCEHGESPR